MCKCAKAWRAENLFALLVFAVIWPSQAANWPAWRGPEGTGCVFTVAGSGIAECFELDSGKALWQERLTGTGGNNGSWSSIVLADGKLYVPNQSGDVFVLRASRKFELLAVNSVHEPTHASLAVSDGEIFLRTDKSLRRVGGSKSQHSGKL